ncbi:sensor domain-containing diguanylate cyclase [Pleurocapsales cyanobacterium LEGE 06147]|nr:sensor domain-containing diguanylate cyclase [Pleurocapsales cyanobacterium LEGE 06147]
MWELLKDFLCWEQRERVDFDYELKKAKSTNSDINLNLQQLNQRLVRRIEELENLYDELVRVNEIVDFLRACETVAEARGVIADLLQPFFPHTSGAILLIDRLSNLVETVASWGTSLNTISAFSRDRCWALRRGTVHEGKKIFPSLYCQHVQQTAELEATLCVPMIARGETVGLLYLSFQQEKDLTKKVKRLAKIVAKQVALAFIDLQLQENLQNQSCRDSLTGLYNRRYLKESSLREVKRAAREEKPIGVIMLDIDHFKHFNDFFGHEAGDAVLREIGILLKKMSRESDIACRYGGEEMTLILPNASKENTNLKAEQIRRAIKNLRIKYGEQLLSSITVSIGVACFPEDGESWNELLRAADRALYLAKNQGRDRVISSPTD